MQTSFEVVDALLRGKPAERMGCSEFVWEQTLGNWVADGYPTDDNGKRVEPWQGLDLDMAYVFCGLEWQPLVGAEEVVEESDEWKVVKNGAGALLKWWKTKAGTPEHIDFTMTSRQVWERDYRPLLMADHDEERIQNQDNIRKALADIRAAKKWACTGAQFIWENMRGSLGDYTLYISMVEDPDWIHDYARVYTDMYKRCLKTIFERSGVPDGFWLFEDLGYKDRLFVSPQCYAELIFPYFRELVEFLHGYDLPVVLHTCGFVESALDMIVEAGFDGLNPMEVKAGNDIFRIVDGYADKLCFVGGMDARIIERADKNEIRAEVTRLTDGMKARGGRWLFGSDHSLSTNVKYDAYKYAMEVYRENAAY